MLYISISPQYIILYYIIFILVGPTPRTSSQSTRAWPASSVTTTQASSHRVFGSSATITAMALSR